MSNGYQKLSTPSRTSNALRGSTVSGKTVLLLALALCSLVRYILYPSSRMPVTRKTPGKLLPPAHLHVVIPASKPDVNLCKLLLSVAVLGYPTPAIINWNQVHGDTGLDEGEPHLAKISAIYEYLNSFDATSDDDLVLIVDAYDIWLQLRPQTLVDRYFDINRRADARILSELGPAAVQYDMRQKILLGTQVECRPQIPDDPTYHAIPESEIPDSDSGPPPIFFDPPMATEVETKRMLLPNIDRAS